jgi:hypothetical protein
MKKSTVLWNVTPYILVEVNFACFLLVACLAYSSTLRMKAVHSSEMSAHFTKLHASQPPTPTLMVTAMRISNPTFLHE